MRGFVHRCVWRSVTGMLYVAQKNNQSRNQNEVSKRLDFTSTRAQEKRPTESIPLAKVEDVGSVGAYALVGPVTAEKRIGTMCLYVTFVYMCAVCS